MEITRLLLTVFVAFLNPLWGAEPNGVGRIGSIENYHGIVRHVSKLANRDPAFNQFWGGDAVVENRSSIFGYRNGMSVSVSVDEESLRRRCDPDRLYDLVLVGSAILESSDDYAPYVKEGMQKPGFIGGSLVGDIQQTILDSDRFWLALRKKQYFVAWTMASSNQHPDQHPIWTEATLEATKEGITTLTREFVMEFDRDAETRLIMLLQQFADTPVHPDLSQYSVDQRNKFERKKADILQSPALRVVQADLHRLAVDRLLHAEQ